MFVWLRYSAARQLTWQRNYNTQPRILGEAQARLTATIAKVCAPETKCSPQGTVMTSLAAAWVGGPALPGS